MGHAFITKIIVVLLMLLAMVAFLYTSFKLFIIWVPFFMAWWISNLLSPLVEKIHKRTKINKSLITFITLLLFVSMMLLIFSSLGWVIVNQARNLSNKFPEIRDIIQNGVYKVSDNIVHFTDLIPSYLTDNLNLDLPKLLEKINLSVTTILASIVGIAAVIPNFLVGVIVMLVASFFMTKEKIALKEMEMKLWSHKIFRSPFMTIIYSDVIMVLFGYIKAQLILMVLTFTEVAIGLTILKIPNSVLIALGIGLLDALPVLGTGSVFIPWILILIFYKNYSLAVGISVVYLLATFGRQALEPKIISTQIGVPPLITLLVIYTGIKLFGILGIVIAPLTVIILLALKKSELLKFE